MATIITDPLQGASIVDQFRLKYGVADLGKYYSKLDVAVAAELQ